MKFDNRPPPPLLGINNKVNSPSVKKKKSRYNFKLLALAAAIIVFLSIFATILSKFWGITLHPWTFLH